MPNRIIKESICTSESIDSLSYFEEVLFYRLVVNCDDYGLMDARPKILKAKLFPLRDRLATKDIEDALGKLADAGCVELYEVDGKPYLCLPTWGVHQRIRNKKSKYPIAKADSQQTVDSKSRSTVALNPIQSNPNPIRIQSETESNMCADCGDVFSVFEKCGFQITGYTGEELPALVEQYGNEWVTEAIRRAADQGQKKLAYVKGILNNWNIAGAMDEPRPKKNQTTYEGREVDGPELDC